MAKAKLTDPIDFLSFRYITAVFSVVLLAYSAYLLIAKGMNYGIDFEGGVLIEARFDQAPDLVQMRQTFKDMEIGETGIQNFGSPEDVLIRLRVGDEDEAVITEMLNQVKSVLGEGVEYRRVETVGPKVGSDLREGAIWAVSLSLIAILMYITMRFEWQYGAAAVLAIFHDVFLTLGFFSLFNFEFNLPSLAAILTIAGYSINDTIVVFDRVRENRRKFRSVPLYQVVNSSLTETLSRTLLTSFTTLLAVSAFLFFGGEVIRDFNIVLMWGVFVGTYSSIYIASAFLLYIETFLAPSHDSEA